MGLEVKYISAVKRAKRKEEHATKNKVILQPKEPNSANDQKYTRKLGATPKEMISLSESNSAPKLLPPFNFLANQPSKKSKIEAKTIK